MMSRLRQEDRIREVLSQATTALLEWLCEGWISAPADWNVDKASVQVARDWYGPYWLVTFTMDEPPWFGDSVTVDVEELPQGQLRASVDSTRFARENISCSHREDGFPEGHWTVNEKPRLTGFPPDGILLPVRSGEPHCSEHGSKTVAPPPSLSAGQRPRDLGWADSRHWMEEEI